MSSNEPSDAVAGVPLEALVADRRGRCEAVSRLQGGSTHYHEELGIFRKTAEEQRLHLDPPPAELSGPPDDEGNEHQVWFCPGSRSVLKATWPGFFGLLGCSAEVDPRIGVLPWSMSAERRLYAEETTC